MKTPAELPDLRGKRCLVTGGSRGLGKALCLGLAAKGASVAFTYEKSSDAARATEAELQALCSKPLMFCGDVRDPEHADAVVASLCETWGGLDVLINNAGVFQALPISLIEEDDWDRMMDIGSKGPYLFSRAALRPMLRQKSGTILNIGSFAEGRGGSVPPHYAASKAALRGFSTALAHDVGRHGISVLHLSPGLLDTGLTRRLPQARRDEYLKHNALGRLGCAKEIADLACWMLSEESSFMTATAVVADGGI